jgi:hypothetical protein
MSWISIRVVTKFCALLKDMDELRQGRFPRRITPKVGQFKKPTLMILATGPVRHAVLLIYLR